MRLTLFLYVLIMSLRAGAQSDSLIEDSPGSLVLEARLSGPFLIQGKAGARLSCANCVSSAPAGSPDLPIHGFSILSGPEAPRITIRVLESETRTVPEGMAPAPTSIGSLRQEYIVDPELYRSASAASARIGPVRALRGAPVRIVEVPMALWSEGSKTLTILKRIRIEAAFPGVLPVPASPLAGRYRGEIRNPVGGAYLYRSAARKGLGKRAGYAEGAAAGSPLVDTLIRIRVGDRVLDNLDEDRFYSFPFAAAARLAASIHGVRTADLRMYSGPMDTLPRHVDALGAYPGNLSEVPIEVRDKNGNGTFDEPDSVRFYGHGTSIWRRDSGGAAPEEFRFSADPYSFENFYYLDFSGKGGGGAPLRLEDAKPMAPGPSKLTSAYHYLRAEKDEATATCSIDGVLDPEAGFDWHWHWNGACGSQSEKTLGKGELRSGGTDTLPRAVVSPSEPLYIGISTSPPTTHDAFKVYLKGSGMPMGRFESPGGTESWYTETVALPASGALSLDSMRWTGNAPRFEGFTVAYPRTLALDGERTWIFPPVRGKATYQVEGADGAACLRIEGGIPAKRMILDGSGTFTDSLDEGSDARYLVYRAAAPLPSGAFDLEVLPASAGPIRDLASADGKDPEYLILTGRPLLKQALSLRDYRNDAKRSLRVRTEVVLVEDIYRQYSGGRLSPPAIRDFLRWAYSGWGRGGAGPGSLKYVVLMGDGHYDYRGIAAAKMNVRPPMIIPPYEFFLGHEIVASDDFFGLLDPGDEPARASMIDVAVGRIPVGTPEEAAAYVEKVKAYEAPSNGGDWRGRVLMAADDDVQRAKRDGIKRGHTTDSDALGKIISRNQPGTMVDDVYLLDYPMNTAYHKPEATQDLLASINRGLLVVNYIGHGSSSQWADEALAQTNDALARMQNTGRTPMVNSFSCTVGRFESLESEGLSEKFVKASGKGAIAAIAATRESLAPENIALAKAFYERAFPPASDPEATIGDAFREAKNAAESSGNNNDSRYVLLGEPVLFLRRPRLELSFSKVLDTVKALDCDTLRGRVEGGSGNGFINIKIVAGAVRKVYPTPLLDPFMSEQIVDKRGGILFERTFPYKNHEFSADYFIPKQIPFGDSNAQVLAFAWDSEREMEGLSAKMGLRIQGVSNGTCKEDGDGKGPRIRITGCEKKETGSLDFPPQVRIALPYCLEILVEDSLGGVLSAEGPDEGTTLEIPGSIDPFHPRPGIDDLYAKTYRIALDKRSLRPGVHVLKVSARDGYGNISQRSLRMDLTLDSSLNLVKVFNAPNPMKRNGTVFHFLTVMPSPEVDYEDPSGAAERLEFEIRIFNQRGDLVTVLERAESGRTSWDGRDRWGNMAANGVYFYKVTATQRLGDSDPARPSYRTLSSKRNILVISR